MSQPMDKAVILARGLGTRMRRADESAKLTQEQAAVAETGVKALIPVKGGTFLDYVLSALADAGYKQICLIIGPEHDYVREYFASLKTERISIDFAVQAEPLGTADAVAAAKTFSGDSDFLVINSDNYYPPDALGGLRDLDGPGLAGFEKQHMLDGSNIPGDRIAKFAVIQIDENGRMAEIIEKPTEAQLAALPEPQYLSMNCWRFGPSIYEACANIQPSARGELEIPDAVQYSIDKLGESYRVVEVSAPVLDLSSRADVEGVVAKMNNMEIRL